jgi:hypothetical protein
MDITENITIIRRKDEKSEKIGLKKMLQFTGNFKQH